MSSARRPAPAGESLRQHASEDTRRGTHAVVLQQVNQFAQSALIAAIGHRPIKGTIDAPAHRTSPETIVIPFAHRTESTRSPQIEQTLPRMGSILARQSGQTGSREIFSRGSPQMRQSEGNRTEKRLSATRSKPTQRTRGRDQKCLSRNNRMPCDCNCGLAGPDSVLTTAEDGLLIIPRTESPQPIAAMCAATSSIAAMAAARQRCGWRRGCTVSGIILRTIRQAVAHRSKNQPVVPPETFSAAHRLHKNSGRNKPFAQGAAARAKTDFAAAITATVRRNQRVDRGSLMHYTSEKPSTKGVEPISPFYTNTRGRVLEVVRQADVALRSGYFDCRNRGQAVCRDGRHHASSHLCSIFARSCKVCMTTQYCAVFAWKP